MNDPFHLFLNLHANLDGYFHTFLLWLKIGNLWISFQAFSLNIWSDNYLFDNVYAILVALRRTLDIWNCLQDVEAINSWNFSTFLLSDFPEE